MDRIRRDNTGVDVDGRPVRRPLPDTYWDLDRENQQLKREIETAEVRQKQLRRDAAELEKREPNPPFRGALALIGEDGVPVIVPPPVQPATQPASTQPPEHPSRVAGSSHKRNSTSRRHQTLRWAQHDDFNRRRRASFAKAPLS
jgi:hypothetical protein